jgi:predicted nucleic acid-binding protein
MAARKRSETALNPVIVDSSVLIDYLIDRSTPHTDWLKANLRRRRLGITTLILTEVLQGIRGEAQFAATLEALERFVILDGNDEGIAVLSARNYRALREKGITIRNTIDCLTATFCVETGFELLHSDRDFDLFAMHMNLKIVEISAIN